MADITHGTWIKDGKPINAVYQNGAQVYGRNLCLNSKSLKNSYAVNDNAKVTVEPFDSTTNMWHIVAEQGAGANSGMYFWDYGNEGFPDNSDWSYSADVKGTGKVQVFDIDGSSRTSQVIGTIGSEWSRISQTGLSNNHTSIDMYFNTTDSPLDIYIKLPKLETGTTATPYSPAPEDILN